MSAADAIAYASIAELGRRYRAKEVSPVEVVTALLARIESSIRRCTPSSPSRGSAPSPRRARRRRRSSAATPGARSSASRSGYKDIYCTRGIRTTGGSALLADWVPDVDATTVTQLQAAGTVMMGKLITHEFAMGIQFPGASLPAATNPWNAEHMPGGSSSGSGAALAAGLLRGGDGLGHGRLHPRAGGVLRHRRASSRRTDAAAAPACSRCRGRSTTPGRWRARWRTARMLQAMAGHDPLTLPRVASPWATTSRRSGRACAACASACRASTSSTVLDPEVGARSRRRCAS